VATAPNPVRNEEFTRTLAQVLDRPAVFRVPRWGARLAFGKVASVLFSSQRCRPLRALEEGFRFIYPDLDSALLEAVGAFRSRRERVA